MARILDSVLGHQQIIKNIISSFEEGRPGQTYLFVGPEGVGKKLTAMGLAQALLCQKSARACGVCPSCLRVSLGAHESLKTIKPEGTQIKQEQAKEIIDFLSLVSFSQHRVVIIDEAQKMNLVTANKLLKTLEEPPAGTFFFLIAPNAMGLVQTVRSRTRAVQFDQVSVEEMKKKVNAPLWALRSARGSFEKLAELQEGGELELRAKSIEILKLFLNDRDFLLNENWRGELRERTQGQKIVNYWLGFAKDAIYLQEDAKQHIINVDQAHLIKELASLSREFLLGLMHGALQVDQELSAFRDSQLVMEEFYIRQKTKREGT